MLEARAYPIVRSVHSRRKRALQDGFSMDVGTGAGSVIDSQRNCGVQCQIVIFLGRIGRVSS